MRSGRLRTFTVVAVSGAAIGVAAPASATVPAVSGTQHFLGLQTTVRPVITVFADGPIHAAGKDIIVNDTTDRFVFPRGVVTIVHHPRSSHESYDPKTCLGQFRETGVYRLTNGTGRYAHVSGRGTYVVQGYFVGCDRHKPPSQVSVVIDARGPISF